VLAPASHATRTLRRHRLVALGTMTAAAAAGWVALTVTPAGPPRTVTLAAVFVLLILSGQARRRASRWNVGMQSERQVAGQLRRLGRRWQIVHDLPCGRGNLDHLAIGPRGAFAIETKTRTITPQGIAQAARNATWASKRLGVPVTAVLCVARGDMRPRQYGDVICVSANRLRRVLRRTRGDRRDVAELAARLPQR
jgi:hypothetical protein